MPDGAWRWWIGNDGAGFARLPAAIAELTPGLRVVASVEGSRSYGVGLARALTVADVRVVECEQPSRSRHRGKGRSDVIDAHLAVLAALRSDADRLAVPRAQAPTNASNRKPRPRSRGGCSHPPADAQPAAARRLDRRSISPPAGRARAVGETFGRRVGAVTE